MDDARKPTTRRRAHSPAERPTGNGQMPPNGSSRPALAAVMDHANSQTNAGDDRSPERRSFDELMESRRAESRAVWQAFLGPLLSQEETRKRLGLASDQEIDALVRDKRLLALPTHEGDTVYPAFQIAANGQPYPTIRRVIEILDPVVESPYMIASWLKGRKSDLGGRTPMEWLELGRDPRRVVREARLSADHLAHS